MGAHKRTQKKARQTLRPFEEVWRAVRRIPRGKVATYGQVSRLLDGRLTPVGVGWALAGAPDDVPWQRVINSQGGCSTDRQHEGLQRAMLEAEGVRFDAKGRVDLSRYQW